MEDEVPREEEEVAHLLFEAGHLKRVVRSGWWLAGIRQPETVAEHCFRTALIAMVLGEAEGADPAKVMAMSLLHDLGEARVMDHHRLAGHYVDACEGERNAVFDLSARLPETFRERLRAIDHEYREERTLEAQIVHDADRLECFLQALEYHDEGYERAREWASTSRRELRTRTAIRLAMACSATKPSAWWERARSELGLTGDTRVAGEAAPGNR